MAAELKIAEMPAPTAVARPRRITYEKFLTSPEVDPHTEWVDGKVVAMSPVSDVHMHAVIFLLRLIQEFVEQHQAGEVLCEPFQMKTGPDLPGRSPDILFVANRNRSRVKRNYLKGPADLVVEVISPESRSRDRGEKFYEYEKGGVPEYWLIDPDRKQAEFYRRDEKGIYQLVLVGEDGIFRSAVLDGFWLRISWLWQQPTPPLQRVLKEWKMI